MPQVLTAETAVLLTATVQIKTLTVSRKQVTLAVFRQVIEEDILDRETFTLRGVGWGHVRYLIETPPDKAINLVWRRGNELRRCIIHRRASDDRRVRENKYHSDPRSYGMELERYYEAAKSEERRLAAAYVAVVAPLFDLEQIFIAV